MNITSKRALLSLFAITGMSSALASTMASAHDGEEPAPDNRPYIGVTGSESIASTGSVRSTAGRAKGLRQGVIAYRGQTGWLCLAAGPMKDGKVGQVGRQGWRQFDAAAAPGICGDLDLDLAKFGGTAFGSQSASAEDPAKPQATAYGLVERVSTRVEVTFPGGTSVEADVRPVPGMGRASGAFSVALPLGVELPGTTVTLTSPSGTVLHRFEL